ncbi:MAG: TonB-dependent receptor [Bacteroidetes bacterium]|nr:TonB-dependent receptor [Bacteroidota bacterium]
MYRPFILFTWLLLLVSLSDSIGQSSENQWFIEGALSIQDRKLHGASVSLQHTGIRTITDKDGRFELKGTTSGNFLLVIHGLGFSDFDTLLHLEAGKTTLLDLKLDPGYCEMPQLEIFSSRYDAMRNLPGAASLVTAEQIEKIQPLSSNEVLRKVGGVHVVDEEGLGLRPNIGFRGLDPDRSRYVMVLEDGVPVSLSPYGEPEMYYSPSIDRMQQVEVLKGSSSILFGPRTIAGVINYRTADPPAEQKGVLQLTAGDQGFASAMLGFGTTIGNTGVQLNYLRKQTDDFGMLRLRMNDVVTKFRWFLSARSVAGIKIGVYDEFSNANYIGMTESMYQSGQYDVARLAPDDQFHIRRYSLSGTYTWNVSDQLRIEGLAFAYSTQRNWVRQDFAYNTLDSSGMLLPKPSDYSGVTWGDESVSGGAIYMRNSTGNRYRTFDVAGADLRLRYTFQALSMRHEWSAGIRFMAERAHEIRVNGSKPGALSGEISDEEYRPIQGYSAFIYDQIHVGNKWEISPGIRVEYMDFTREIVRGKYKVNGVTQARDTVISTRSQLSEVIPGIGFVYHPAKKVCLFGGVHKGFAPPRIKDAITTDGVDQELSAELSWNYELGIRADFFQSLHLELTGFYLDFENQVIPVSESSGGTGAGLVNGGETKSTGVEATLSFSSANIISSPWQLSLLTTMTYTEALFDADRFIGTAENAVNIKGNTLPYAPTISGNSLLSVLSPIGLRFNVNMQYTGAQFTDVKNTEAPAANGLTGELPAFYTVDAGLSYEWKKANTQISCSVKNVTDERYIYTRRPQGIRVGLERMIFFGVKKNF